MPGNESWVLFQTPLPGQTQRIDRFYMDESGPESPQTGSRQSRGLELLSVDRRMA